jgi:predicted small metal-binding protein
LSGYGNRRVGMAYLINCECGAQVRAEDEDSLVNRVERHVADTHPELKGKMTRDDIMAMAEQV